MPRVRRDTVTFPIVLRELRVLRVSDVTPGMRRVTLGGPQLRGFTSDGIELPALRSEGFDDHVKVFVPAPGEARPALPRQAEGHLDWAAAGDRPVAKDYTPRRYDPEAGELDLDFVRHGVGAAAEWVERVRVGDPGWIAGPKSSAAHPRDVDWMLVGGDETALPAIGRWLSQMPPQTRGQVFVEVTDPAHVQDLAHPAGVTVTWVPAGDGVLEAAVRAAEWWPGTVYAWFAGRPRRCAPSGRTCATSARCRATAWR